MPLLVGTSGWQYRDWAGRFYPRGLPTGQWLEHALAAFRTVEVNASFYRLPRREVVARWAERSPADAVFAVKASRYLTHVKRLREPEEPVARLLDRIEPLGAKLGPVLLQLPPDLAEAAGALDATLARFPAGTRLAVETRHASWWTGEVRAVLEARGAALVWADRRGVLGPLWRTADWGYLRFHEGRAAPWPRYGRQAIATWAARVSEAFPDTADVYAYFNNDPGAAAVDDARAFARAAARLGRTVSRVPAPQPATG